MTAPIARNNAPYSEKRVHTYLLENIRRRYGMWAKYENESGVHSMHDRCTTGKEWNGNAWTNLLYK